MRINVLTRYGVLLVGGSLVETVRSDTAFHAVLHDRQGVIASWHALDPAAITHADKIAATASSRPGSGTDERGECEINGTEVGTTPS